MGQPEPPILPSLWAGLAGPGAEAREFSPDLYLLKNFLESLLEDSRRFPVLEDFLALLPRGKSGGNVAYQQTSRNARGTHHFNGAAA